MAVRLWPKLGRTKTHVMYFNFNISELKYM